MKGPLVKQQALNAASCVGRKRTGKSELSQGETQKLSMKAVILAGGLGTRL